MREDSLLVELIDIEFMENYLLYNRNYKIAKTETKKRRGVTECLDEHQAASSIKSTCAM